MIVTLLMPNKHAAIKDLRKSRKRTVANKRMKTHVKSLTQQFKNLLKEGKRTDAAAMASKLQQAIDKAAKDHIFHANKASRNISYVHRSLVTK